MDDLEDIELEHYMFLIVVGAYLALQRNHREHWVHPLNQTRQETSVINRFQQLRQYPDRFHAQYRMTPHTFDYLLAIVGPRIRRQDTVMRKAIDPETRLCVTLHFLATGMNFNSLAYIYALGRKTVSDMVYDCCEALWDMLCPIYLKPPTNHNEWRSISQRFLDVWNFPNCVGAIDGKHIHMRAPDNTGTLYFNYKKSFSINLMAIAGADYRFIMVDIGQTGSCSDGGVWERSQFGQAWKRGEVNVPPPISLPNTEGHEEEYVLIADEAFPLQTNLLRPFARRDQENDMVKKRFNYRLSRARRVVENTFGILSARWRVLFTPLDADGKKAASIVQACCVLHNMLCSLSDNAYVPPGYADQPLPNGEVVEGLWRQGDGMPGLNAVARGHAAAASNVRTRFSQWFSGPGAVDWQDGYITRIR